MRRLVFAAAALAALALPAPVRAQEGDVPAGCAGKTLASRVVTVRFKPLPEAAMLVEQLLGPCGAYRVPKALRVITVTDEPQQLERVAQALASWDVPPRPVEISVSLILATREPAPGKNQIMKELRDVSEQLAQLTRFTHYERLGTATVRAVEGGGAEAEIGERYTVSFKVGAVDPDHNIVRLEPFELYQRPDPSETGASEQRPRRLLAMLQVNLPEGTQNLVGAPARGNERALFLALTAWTTKPAAAAAPGARDGD